ncbi:response regulator [Fulvivirga sp. 29W222]|uniref:Response regulator n=1 Tax=Fulvivirga marina TaxID=2494733 RepID=A0A937KG87_9BACT|nr:response regulator transcription factor [Fulvivirga marina]MBL6448938.1 response regulator [Fulvivirga marina]
MNNSINHKILIVDDDKDILDLLQYNLEKDGYTVKVERKGTHSLETAGKFHPDLIILDIMMPKINGIEVCRQLREHPDFKNTYIFFLTAKSDKQLQLKALDTGGDDYIEKITGLRTLTHKISTVLKKDLVIRKSIEKINIGDMTIDRRASSVTYKSKKMSLPKYEFELLYFFAQNPKKVITRDNLVHNIWGSDVYVLARSVDTYITNLTQKIGEGLISRIEEGKYKFQVK